MELFTQRLLDLRKSTKLSQAEMAKALGISYRSYRRYESGNSEPTLSTLICMAQYFHVSIDFLAGLAN